LHGVQEKKVKGHWHGNPELLGTPQAGPVGWMDGVDMQDCEQCRTAEAQRQFLIRRPPYIKENRFGGDLIEYGAISALFEDMPASEVGCMSGSQGAFDAARTFIKEMVANQCKLAGCSQEHWGFVHSEKCWFGQRQKFYAERNKRGQASEV
jgi:hypothetical protein